MLPYLAAVTPLVGGMASGRVCPMPPNPANPIAGWVFGVVWSALYILLGLYLYMLLRMPSSSATRMLLVIFLVNLALNFAWTPTYSCGPDAPNTGLSLAVIYFVLLTALLLWGCTLRTASTGHMHMFLAPYIAWLIFASALNLQIHRRT